LPGSNDILQGLFRRTAFLSKVAGTPYGEHLPEEVQEKILHASLVNGSLSIMASEMIGEEGYTPGNTVYLMVNCDSEKEVKKLYGELSAGGKVLGTLERTFWGGTFGAFTDKFGTNWYVNFDNKTEPVRYSSL
jgi:PhnB protein